jgi:glycerol dehydrogenase-like iron-containing ADH family enzyme
MHGEMVAMGLITMLALENDMEQLEKVARFCAIVGLPNNFDQLALDLECQSDLEKIAEMTCQQWFTHNEPFEVTPSKVIQAMKTGHLIGKRIADELGNAAFERIHKAN